MGIILFFYVLLLFLCQIYSSIFTILAERYILPPHPRLNQSVEQQRCGGSVFVDVLFILSKILFVMHLIHFCYFNNFYIFFSNIIKIHLHEGWTKNQNPRCHAQVLLEYMQHVLVYLFFL